MNAKYMSKTKSVCDEIEDRMQVAQKDQEASHVFLKNVKDIIHLPLTEKQLNRRLVKGKAFLGLKCCSKIN